MKMSFKNIELYVGRLVEIYKLLAFPGDEFYQDKKIEEDPVKYLKSHISDTPIDPAYIGKSLVYKEADPTIIDAHQMKYSDIAYFATLLKSDMSWNEYGEPVIVIRYDEMAIAKDPVLKRTGLNPFDIYGGLLREARSYVFSTTEYDYEKNRFGIHTASVPFYKFMNMGQTEEYSLENIKRRIEGASYVEFTQKMDGCFMQAFYDRDEVQTTTACSFPHLENAVIAENTNRYFMCRSNLTQMVEDNPNWTFMFESIFDFTHQIVQYTKDEYGLYLIGMRNKNTGEIARYSLLKAMSEMYDVKVVKKYDLSFDAIETCLRECNGTQLEGFVANIDGFLVKMKTDDYLSLVSYKHQGKFENAAIEAYDRLKLDDFVPTVPESLKYRCDEVINEASHYYSICEDVATKFICDAKRIGITHAEVDQFVSYCPKCIRQRVASAVHSELNGKDYEFDFLGKGGGQSTISYNEMMENTAEIEEYLNK